MAVKEIDLGSGAEIRSIYSPKDKPAIIDAARGIRLQQSDAAMTVTNQVTTVGRNGIASTMITYADGKNPMLLPLLLSHWLLLLRSMRRLTAFIIPPCTAMNSGILI